MNNFDVDVDDDHDDGVPPTTDEDQLPFPPGVSCIAALGFVSFLLFMGFLLALFAVAFLFSILGFLWMIKVLEWFRGKRFGMGGTEDSGDPQDEEKAVKILERILRAVKGRERGRRESKKAVGPIECFGSQGIAELGYSECTICLEDFQVGEKCLVIPGCCHIFHCKCIVGWLSRKLTCPLCRYDVA